jgi:hypothetical protein
MESGKFKVKALPDLVSRESLLSGLHMHLLIVYSHDGKNKELSGASL